MTKVYVVTSGDYSSYQINAVFSTEELARAYCDLHNRATGYSSSDDEYAAEEYELDEDKSVIGSSIYWAVNFGRGDELWTDSSFIPSDPFIEDYTDRYGRQIVTVSGVVARDRESAIKIAAERRAQFLAERESIA